MCVIEQPGTPGDLLGAPWRSSITHDYRNASERNDAPAHDMHTRALTKIVASPSVTTMSMEETLVDASITSLYLLLPRSMIVELPIV